MRNENPSQEEINTPDEGYAVEKAVLPANFSGKGLSEMLRSASGEAMESELESQEAEAKAIGALRSKIQSSLESKISEEGLVDSANDEHAFFDKPAVDILKVEQTHKEVPQSVEESVVEAKEITPKSPADMFNAFADSLSQTNPQKAVHYEEISRGLREEGDKKMMAIEDAILDLEELIGNRFVSAETNAQYKQAFDELQNEYEKIAGAPYDASTMDRIGRLLGAGFRSLLRSPNAVGHPAMGLDRSLNNPHLESSTSLGIFGSENNISLGRETTEVVINSTEEAADEKKAAKPENTAEMSPDWRTLITFSNKVLDAHKRDTPEDFAKWFTSENEEKIRSYLRAMVKYHIDGKINTPGATSPDNVASVMDNSSNLILQQIMRAKGRPALGDSETLNMSFSHFAKEYLDMDVRDINPDYGKYFSPRAGSLPEIYGNPK